jgi:trk system potassium uptake protein
MAAGLVKIVGTLADYPARSLFTWYLGLVAAGTGLLLLPFCRPPGIEAFSLSEALFTAASAASVTGLMVISVESQLSFIGQLVVLMLIQLGGLGVMSIGTLLFVSLTRRQPLQFRLLTSETLGAPLGANVGRLILMVLAVTLVVEAAGTLALLLARIGDGPLPEVLWWAVFHSVSGFCNAGIGLQDSSLAPWSGDPAVVLSMAALIIAGGLGFPVLLDLFHLRREYRDRRSLRFHSRLVFTATAILLAAGTAVFWVLERDGALAGMHAPAAAMNAFFQSVTVRTAGFNTLPVEGFSNPALFVMMLLMIIGGSSCSTAGGIKVSTATVLALEATATVRRRWQTAAFRQRVPERVLRTAAAVLSVYLLILGIGFMLLLVLEGHDTPHAEAGGDFLDLAFEAVSALGTVGLSADRTADLGEPARLVVIAMMVLGRVGPLAMASLFLQSPKGPRIRYPESEVIVG